MAMAGRTNRPLLLVLLNHTFILLASLERPPIFFSWSPPHPSQGSVLGGVRFDNTNGIKHPYIIGVVPVAVAVPLVPVLAVIVIVLLAIISPIPVLFCLW